MNSQQPDVKVIARLNGEGEGTEDQRELALERECGGTISQYPSADFEIIVLTGREK